MTDPAVVQVLQRFKEALLLQERQQMAEMALRYLEIERSLAASIQMLADEMALRKVQGLAVTPGALYRLDRYKALHAQARVELERYTRDYANPLIARMQAQYAQLGIEAAWQALSVSAIGVSFKRLPIEAIMNMVGFTGDGAPLQRLLAQAYPEAMDGMIRQLIESTARGVNPRATAAAMANGLGLGLDRVLVIARTEQLRAFRMASTAQYRESGIVQGFKRLATKDSRTCFPEGTLVLTSRGNVPIETLCRGDMVLTGAGRWRPVAGIMQRHYAGDMVTGLFASGGRLEATQDHPILLERNGNLYWERIGDAQVGDNVICTSKCSAQALNHGRSNGSIERRISNAYNQISFGAQTQRLASIGVRASMPVNAVNLQGNIVCGQVKIDGVPINASFLDIGDAQGVQAKPYAALRFGFASMSAIAGWAAKLLIGHGGDDSELLPAMLAEIDHRGAAALFRTVARFVAVCGERLSASLAKYITRLFRAACPTTTLVAVSIACGNSELFSTRFTGLGDILARARGIVTVAGTKPSALLDIAWARLKGASAMLTDQRYAFALGGLRTGATTELPPFVDAGGTGRGTRERFSALRAKISGNHRRTISRVARQCKSLTVYNLEVEEDHTFFANGVLVHNCMACLVSDGEVFRSNQELSDHPGGRCAVVPILMVGPEVQWQTGSEWFNDLDAATQERMMGAEKYGAWKDGKFALEDLRKTAHSDTWGDSPRVATLSELGIA